MQLEQTTYGTLLTLYSIQEFDGTDGHCHAFYVETEETAKQLTVGMYMKCTKVELKVVSGVLGAADALRKEEARQKALNKLSDADKRVLGLL